MKLCAHFHLYDGDLKFKEILKFIQFEECELRIS